jgi:hypothetical protein
MARPVTAYVANTIDHTVAPIELSTNTAGAAIPVDGESAAIAITRDASKAYVANIQGNSVTPFDLGGWSPAPAWSRRSARPEQQPEDRMETPPGHQGRRRQAMRRRRRHNRLGEAIAEFESFPVLSWDGAT